ncbi:hypothetical protein KSC_062380 [Ktedonobacter sp. SOSP1-52]|nr:hypothetical protein KSC_062380 [Ktedonobacter sp. SOSP1-52]
MFTGLFPTGATALCCEGGEFNLDLVERAPLAFSPEGKLVMTKICPVLAITELSSVGERGRVGSYSFNLFGGEIESHVFCSPI